MSKEFTVTRMREPLGDGPPPDLTPENWDELLRRLSVFASHFRDPKLGGLCPDTTKLLKFCRIRLTGDCSTNTGTNGLRALEARTATML